MDPFKSRMPLETIQSIAYDMMSYEVLNYMYTNLPCNRIFAAVGLEYEPFWL